MVQEISYLTIQRPIVLIFTDEFPLGISLIETLVANFCNVKVVTSDKDLWQKRYQHIFQNKFVEFFDEASFGKIGG